MKRIYHTWNEWECYPAGFYESSARDKGYTDTECRTMYADFLRDIPRFREALEEVLHEWPNSCEHYLTNDRMNRIAWLGQASMCYATGIPSTYCNGFSLLTKEEQHRANLAAFEYLNRWLTAHGEAELPTLRDAERKTQPELY